MNIGKSKSKLVNGLMIHKIHLAAKEDVKIMIIHDLFIVVNNLLYYPVRTPIKDSLYNTIKT
jgi:hypothetical protein